MSDRYFSPDLDSATGEYLLTGGEAHHLKNVLRRRPGDHVELFDGNGRWAEAEVLRVDRKEARLRILAMHHARDEASTLTVACAIPKGDRAVMLVEKCTELGVARLIPLRTERSVTHPGDGKLERLRRTVLEGCKQSGRRVRMEISELHSWAQFVPNAETPGWMLDPSGGQAATDSGELPATVAVGPEGGWSDAELELGTRHGWQVVGIPGHVLRVETAAITVAGWARLRGRPESE